MLRKIFDRVGRRAITTAVIVLSGLAIIARTAYLVSISQTGGNAQVAIFYDPVEERAKPEVRAAYEQFFVENGIPHRWISIDDAILLPWGTLPRDIRAIVLPDRICQRVHDSFNTLLTSYTRRGGVVVAVQDAGDQDRNGFYRAAGTLDSLLGVHYIRVAQNQSRAFALGEIRFASPEAVVRWNFPAGKVDADRYLVGYGYGRLRYAVNVAQAYDPATDVDVTSNGSPVVARRAVGAGSVIYVNLPLGELKAGGDSLPMQALLRTGLLGAGTIPHLVAAPDGIGRLVVNFHIDSNAEWLGIPNLARHHLLRKDVRMEFDVTAGPDVLHFGDGRGFNACGGRGRPFLQELARYGTIGDHGGWAHNYFAFAMAAGRLTRAEIAALVDRNSRCLESVTGRPIRSYAAPDGVHPQPEMTQILEDQGIDSYYYTGDSGAPVLRPFYNGKIVGTNSWAYPILTLGTDASVQEMAVDHIAPRATERWLQSVLDFAAAQRGIYLVYTHSYDLRVHPQYIPAYSAFLDGIEREQRLGRMRTITMPEATAFMQRYAQTTFHYAVTGGELRLELENPLGLRGIAFAVPVRDVARASGLTGRAVALAGVEPGYYIFAVRTNATHLALSTRG